VQAQHEDDFTLKSCASSLSRPKILLYDEDDSASNSNPKMHSYFGLFRESKRGCVYKSQTGKKMHTRCSTQFPNGSTLGLRCLFFLITWHSRDKSQHLESVAVIFCYLPASSLKTKTKKKDS
ncbi:unnamed protein product, partial [Brassica rapa subsp. narinosa]